PPPPATTTRALPPHAPSRAPPLRVVPASATAATAPRCLPPPHGEVSPPAHATAVGRGRQSPGVGRAVAAAPAPDAPRGAEALPRTGPSLALASPRPSRCGRGVPGARPERWPRPTRPPVRLRPSTIPTPGCARAPPAPSGLLPAHQERCWQPR